MKLTQSKTFKIDNTQHIQTYETCTNIHSSIAKTVKLSLGNSVMPCDPAEYVNYLH